MKLRDVMTHNVESIQPDASLLEAARKMKSLDIGIIPVLEHDKPVGIITDRDITVRGVAEGRDPSTTRVSDLMTRNVVCVIEDEDVKKAAELMQKKQIRRLLVSNQQNHIVGIVSLGDLATDARDTKLTGRTLEEVSKPSEPTRKVA